MKLELSCELSRFGHPLGRTTMIIDDCRRFWKFQKSTTQLTQLSGTQPISAKQDSSLSLYSFRVSAVIRHREFPGTWLSQNSRGNSLYFFHKFKLPYCDAGPKKPFFVSRRTSCYRRRTNWASRPTKLAISLSNLASFGKAHSKSASFCKVLRECKI